ncbi:hypothetical protein JCM33374_g5728 [Metschnikowia sp. JCM 33374]|nr:hypothetical protein JCM33374_g5728 [Metschnikowia sp. JCM 33374]
MSSNTPSKILSSDLVQRLENEYRILHLIYHRNYNQHHVAVWWKDLNILHRNVRKILRKIYDFEVTKKHILKQRLHNEAVAIARFMVKKRIFSSCYYSFNGVVALGQFISLGLTLLASLSALHNLIMSIDGLASKLEATKMPSVAEKGVTSHASSVIPEDDDLGEEIVFTEKPAPLRREKEDPILMNTPITVPKRKFEDIDSIFGEKPKKKKEKKEKKEKNKLKKKKSAIDDIFG